MTQLPFDPDLSSDADVSAEPGPFSDRSPSRRGVWREVGTVLAVSAGGVVGGCGRYLVDVAILIRGRGFPWGTFAVNIIGAFLLALLLILVLEVWRPVRYVRPFLAVGVLGSFTTFSTFIVDVDQFFANGQLATAVAYLVLSIVAGLAATSAGLVCGRGVVSHGHSNHQQPSTEEVDS